MNIGSYVYDIFDMFTKMYQTLTNFLTYKLGSAVENLTITSGIVDKLGLSNVSMSSLLIGGGLLVLIVYSIVK